MSVANTPSREIAQHLVNGTPVDQRIAEKKATEWLTDQLVDALTKDEWGDVNSRSALEDVVLRSTENLGLDLAELDYSDNGEVCDEKAKEFIDRIMLNDDDIIADAEDRLIDNDEYTRSPSAYHGLKDDDFF